MRELWEYLKRTSHEHWENLERTLQEHWENFERTLKKYWKTLKEPWKILERILKEPWISLELTLKEQKCDGVSECVTGLVLERLAPLKICQIISKLQSKFIFNYYSWWVGGWVRKKNKINAILDSCWNWSWSWSWAWHYGKLKLCKIFIS